MKKKVLIIPYFIHQDRHKHDTGNIKVVYNDR